MLKKNFLGLQGTLVFLGGVRILGYCDVRSYILGLYVNQGGPRSRPSRVIQNRGENNHLMSRDGSLVQLHYNILDM